MHFTVVAVGQTILNMTNAAHCAQKKCLNVKKMLNSLLVSAVLFCMNKIKWTFWYFVFNLPFLLFAMKFAVKAESLCIIDQDVKLQENDNVKQKRCTFI